MPPVRKSRMDLMRGWIEHYGSQLQILNDNEVYCVKCHKQFKCSRKHNITMHINTLEHLNQNIDNFNDELCEAFAAANIPLKKLKNPVLKSFLEKHRKRKIPDESTLRKYSVAKVHNNLLDKIKNALKGKYIWLSIDETSDEKGRCVVNIVVGVLEVTGCTKPYLIATKWK